MANYCRLCDVPINVGEVCRKCYIRAMVKLEMPDTNRAQRRAIVKREMKAKRDRKNTMPKSDA